MTDIASPIARWPVLARDGDYSVAMASFAAGAGRPGGGVIMSGEPGVGKTTLASRLVADWRGDGERAVSVVPVICTRTGNTLPWSSLAPNMSAGSLDAAAAMSGAALPASGDSAADGSAADSPASKGSAGGPHILYRIEDANFLDPMSALYISWQARAGQASVVATVRQMSSLPEPLQLLAKDSVVESLKLNALDLAETLELLELALDGPVDPDAARRLSRLTRGNPMYLREIVRSSMRSGELFKTSAGWQWRGRGTLPDTLATLIERDMAGLPNSLREVLELVAFSEPISQPRLLKMIDPADFDSCVRDELITLVRTAERIAPEVVSAHPLKGEVIRAGVNVSQRLKLHQKVNLHRATADDDSPAALLRSTYWALECGVDVATPALVKSARLATELLDCSNAVLLAGAALARADISATERLATLATRALALSFLPQSDGGAADLDTAWELLLAHGLPEPGMLEPALAVAALRANDKLYAGDDPAAAAVELTSARAMLGPAAGPALDIVGLQIQGWAGDFTPVLAAGEAQLAESGGVITEPMLGYFSMFILGLAQRGELHRALLLCREALKVARRCSGDYPWAVGELHSVGHNVVLWLGEIGQLAGGILERRDFDPPYIKYDYTLDLVGTANVARAQGRWSAAIADLALALEKYDAFDRNGLAAYAKACEASVLAVAGRRAEAAGALAESRATRLRGIRCMEPEIKFMQLTAQAALGLGTPAADALELADWAAARGSRITELDALHLYAWLSPAGQAPKGVDTAALQARLSACAGMVDGGRARWLADHARALLAGDDAAARQDRDRLAECGVWLVPKTVQLSLTRREYQVAVLVASGLSNREIGGRLTLSVRTVDSHVGRIFTKLDINSRDQLAPML